MKKLIICCCLALFLLPNCKNQVAYSVYVSSCPTNVEVMRVDIEDVLSNIDRYDGEYIETEGYLSWSMEEMAIYKNSREAKAVGAHLNALTLEPKQGCTLTMQGKNINFFTSDSDLENANKSTIKIRGFINTSEHGHLGMYKAGIGDITFIEVGK